MTTDTEDPNIATQLPAMAERMRQARVMPSREAIAKAIQSSVGDEGWYEAYLKAADAVLRLLSAGQDQTPGPGELAEAIDWVRRIDADELEADIIAVRSLNIYECVPSLRYVAQAAEAHLASLRAPKGELEEARAELGAFLVEKRGAYVFDTGRVGMIAGKPRPDQPWFCVVHMIDRKREGHRGEGPTEAAAIRAALSRARGEGR